MVERLFCDLGFDEKQRFLLCDNISPEAVSLLLPTTGHLEDGQDCKDNGVDLLEGELGEKIGEKLDALCDAKCRAEKQKTIENVEKDSHNSIVVIILDKGQAKSFGVVAHEAIGQ